jgi:hypothetical protein
MRIDGGDDVKHVLGRSRRDLDRARERLFGTRGEVVGDDNLDGMEWFGDVHTSGSFTTRATGGTVRDAETRSVCRAG